MLKSKIRRGSFDRVKQTTGMSQSNAAQHNSFLFFIEENIVFKIVNYQFYFKLIIIRF